MNPSSMLLFASILLAEPAHPGAPPTEAIGIRPLAFGYGSSRLEPGFAVARDREELDQMWADVRALGYPTEFDFRREYIVAYFMGQQSSTGYRATFDGARLVRGEILVEISSYSPSRKCVTAPVETRPVFVAAIARAPVGADVMPSITARVHECPP